MKKLIILTIVVIMVIPAVAMPTSYSTDFEGFSTTESYLVLPGRVGAADGGTIHGQNGWTANEVHVGIDEQVMQINGNTVLRLSNAAGSGNYTGTHPSPAPIQAAGETATGAVWNRFQFSVDFKSASSELQEGLSIDITPYEWGTASRHGILRITDSQVNGLSAGWWDYSGNGFRYTTLATNLNRGGWHNISVDMLFMDGTDNDSVEVKLNNQTTINLTTWEGYYQGAGEPQPNYASVDSVIFRVPTAAAELMGEGLYFDNFSMAVVPEPATLSILGLGGFALLRKRK